MKIQTVRSRCGIGLFRLRQQVPILLADRGRR